MTEFKWNQLPNVECSMRVIQINHNGTIDMLVCHINQLVRCTSGFGKFTTSVLTVFTASALWIRTKSSTEYM
jgi:hypothetical protein